MIILLNKQNFFNTFSISSFDEIEDTFNTLSPSMVEYYLSDLASLSNDNLYLNKSNVEKSIVFSPYYLYQDYGQEIYLEIDQALLEDEQYNDTLW